LKKKLKGFAIFNKTLVEYLYDIGADTTIIQEKIFKQIQIKNKSTQLEIYTGNRIKSFTTEIKILGQIILNKCAFNQSDSHKNIKIIVTENQTSTNECIIGTDLMEQIPDFNNYMQLIEQKIKTMSDDIFKRYSVEKSLEKTNVNQLKNYHIINTIITQDITVDSVRQRVEAQLENCSANQLNEILSKDPQRVKFTIELINPQQKPLEAKPRPLPYHMKD
jgi:hypothetical protein